MLNFKETMQEKNLAGYTNHLDYLPSSLMGTKGQKAVKILHVLMDLSVGGLETWLLQVLRNLDHQRFQIDILVHYPKKGLLEDQAAELSQILRLPHLSNPLHYAQEFRHLLVEQGPYQIIHSHLALGGFHIRWAHQAGVPVRIVHTHADEDQRARHLPLRRRLARKISHHLIQRHATVGLAVSRVSAQGRFGPHWQNDPRFKILPCAISLQPFTGKRDRAAVRRDLSIPESAFVLGHVGRMVPEKNHAFLIDLAADLCRRLPEAYLLLVGDGSMRHRLEDQVRSLGLTQKVLFTGFRDDIAEILQGAMDLFLFPSSYESAGMALVEAQAAGLPCLITDTIPEEVVIIPELVERASLNDGPRGWAEAILANWKHKASLNPIEAVARLRGTLFDLEANVSYLQELYSTVLSCRPHVSER